MLAAWSVPYWHLCCVNLVMVVLDKKNAIRQPLEYLLVWCSLLSVSLVKKVIAVFYNILESFLVLFLGGRVTNMYKMILPKENILVKTTQCIWVRVSIFDFRFFDFDFDFDRDFDFVFSSIPLVNGGRTEKIRDLTMTCLITVLTSMASLSSLMSRLCSMWCTCSSLFQSSGLCLTNKAPDGLSKLDTWTARLLDSSFYRIKCKSPIQSWFWPLFLSSNISSTHFCPNVDFWRNPCKESSLEDFWPEWHFTCLEHLKWSCRYTDHVTPILC